MNFDLERAAKPPRRLRKLLKDLSADPDPETVHDLRTQTRKLEAILHALAPQNNREARRILKLLKPIRRAAGRVRDMDVLIGKTSGLSSHVQSDGLVRLIEHMSALRNRDARRLHRKVKSRRDEARSSLKRFIRTLEQQQAPDHSGVPANSTPPQLLAERLDHWPRLNQQNLHEFRKGVKELRYMLQLVPGEDDHLLNAYAKVKDTAGDWHDWLELKSLAESVLDRREEAVMLREIRATLQQKFHTALNVANSLRKRGIETNHAA